MAARTRILLLVLLAATAAALALPTLAAANPATASVYDSLANLRPDRPAPAGGTASAAISAARNEAESFQVLVQAGAAGNPGLRVDVGAIANASGDTLPASAVTISREAYYRVATRSDGEGATGSWPDALIPERDDLYGEDRSAFPYDLGPSAQVAVWVDILVPIDQAAGDYSGTLTVSDATGAVASVPVGLRVDDFQLPSTSSLKSAYFISWDKICTAFTGNSGCAGASQAWQYETLYAEAALNNRVTLANGYAAGPESPYFSQYFVPLVQGTDSRVRLPGAKLTSVEVYGPSCGNCLAPWKAAAERYGFADRFFLYACDEPYSNADWEACKRNVEAGEKGWPGVHSLVTAPIQAAASSYVDNFTPLVNDMNPASGSKRASYNSFLSGSDKELWMYTSCRSYSCDSSEGSEYNGWPGYAIDEPASQARAMGWTSYQYGASGELYYATTTALTTAATNQYSSGGNGDGNLFYAGTPGGGNGSIAVGGSHPIPLETIRLKRIRDGREDYEYLHLLDQQGQGAAALGVVRGLFGPDSSAGHSTTVSSAAMEGARNQLAEAVTGEELPAPSPAPMPAPETPAPETSPATRPPGEPMAGGDRAGALSSAVGAGQVVTGKRAKRCKSARLRKTGHRAPRRCR
jgi:Domain of unknown function (DUF4091)